MKVAAIQLEPQLSDVAANLDACWRLGMAGGAAGARLIVLPEFFTTGMAFVPALAGQALLPRGPATELLLTLARRFDAMVETTAESAVFHARAARSLRPAASLAGDVVSPPRRRVRYDRRPAVRRERLHLR